MVRGAGTSEVVIEGRPELAGARADRHPRPHRGRHATWWRRAITGGSVRVPGARRDHLEAFIAKLREAKVAVVEGESGVRVEANGKLAAVDVTTMPHPGFPTDLQAQFMALMTRAERHVRRSARRSSRTACSTPRSSRAWAPRSTSTGNQAIGARPDARSRARR